MIQKIIKSLIIILTVCIFGIMGIILKNKWDTHIPLMASEECFITVIPNIGLVKAMAIENNFVEGLTYAVIIKPSIFMFAGSIAIPNADLRQIGFIRTSCFSEREQK